MRQSVWHGVLMLGLAVVLLSGCESEDERVGTDEVNGVEFRLKGRDLRVRFRRDAAAGARAIARGRAVEFGCLTKDFQLPKMVLGRFGPDGEAQVELAEEPSAGRVTCFVEAPSGDDVGAAELE